jgi:hypothetical protein
MKTFIVAMATAILMAGLSGVAHAGDKYLFYIHGCCIKKTGSEGYEAIVKDLKHSGFNVTFDLRYDDSDAEVKAYALKVAGQVKDLLAKGTAPGNITVSGYSLGSVTVLYASIAIANPKVNYVLLAGCPGKGARQFDIDYMKVQGRILSIIDTKDDKFGSCQGRLPENALQKEVAFDSGSGHAIFRDPSEKSIKLWKEPLISWTEGK